MNGKLIRKPLPERITFQFPWKLSTVDYLSETDLVTETLVSGILARGIRQADDHSPRLSRVSLFEHGIAVRQKGHIWVCPIRPGVAQTNRRSVFAVGRVAQRILEIL